MKQLKAVAARYEIQPTTLPLTPGPKVHSAFPQRAVEN
jgi:hypothetical protein